ncbi:MAG: hypothetical protein WDN06_20930 [Asticcacaulis sp.]
MPGLELATQLILDLCGGKASDIVVSGRRRPAGPMSLSIRPMCDS